VENNKSKMAVFHAHGLPFSLEEIRIPDLESGQILIRNEYTTLCRSDVNTWSGKRSEPAPTILGHEIVGRVEKLGPGVSCVDVRGRAFGVGDRLTWAIYASNPDSEISRRGIPQKGPDLFKYGHEKITTSSTLHGGLAEYCILRKHTPVARVSNDLPVSLVSLINCSVSTTAGALRLAESVRGKRVFISGVGMLGVIACAMARVEGAAEIAVLDVDPARLEMARDFGADRLLTPEDLQHGVSIGDTGVAFDFSGQPSAMEAGLSLLGVGGTAVWIGATFPQPDLSLNAEQVVRKIMTIRGLHNYNQEDFIRAVEFMERHHSSFPFADLICGGFQLNDVEAAFERAHTSGVHRVGIELGDK
jgi:putative phosphonate catabolism associated alcohol dehydrogenase